MPDSASLQPASDKRLTARRQPAHPQSRETVARIRDAAGRIIESEGLPKLNSNRIAEVAGVSVGTLYKFFPNKQAILASVVAEWSAERERALQEISRLNPSATLSAQVEDWFRYFVETPASHVLITSKALQFYPELQGIDRAYKARSVELIARGLQRDGCRLDAAATQRLAGSINDLGSHLLSRIIAAGAAEREPLMTWSLMLMRAAIADALSQPAVARPGGTGG